MKLSTREARARRRRRVRGKVSGTSERPRLAVYRSNLGIYAQLVDDGEGRTLAAVGFKNLPKSFKGTKTDQARQEGGLRSGRVRPGRLPVPRTRQGARRGRARRRTEVLT
jgi:large subunit ribosomal protein L18